VVFAVARQSAGILIFRRRNRRDPEAIEVFLVHPGGPFWARRDAGAWSIPKGEVQPGEDLLKRAITELREETGFGVDGPFLPLGPIKQAGGKVVHAWAVEGDCDPAKLSSNTFSLEWPPRSGKRQDFPEVDRAAWFDIKTAEEKINKSQSRFLRALADKLKAG
jgi:predicted NUDIX family NTP pyrophosphohydrolase